MRYSKRTVSADCHSRVRYAVIPRLDRGIPVIEIIGSSPIMTARRDCRGTPGNDRGELDNDSCLVTPDNDRLASLPS